jgi:hypothetical protein
MASSAQQTGMRGVFLVAAELAARDHIVSLTSRNAFGADLLVTDAECKRAWSVQVKTNASTFGFWLLSDKAQKVASPSHVYVFVNLRFGQSPEFYVVPSEVVAANVITTPARNGTWHQFNLDETAQRYRDTWDIFDAKNRKFIPAKDAIVKVCYLRQPYIIPGTYLGRITSVEDGRFTIRFLYPADAGPKAWRGKEENNTLVRAGDGTWQDLSYRKPVNVKWVAPATQDDIVEFQKREKTKAVGAGS